MLKLEQIINLSIINQKSIKQFLNTKVLIVGLGKTGIAAARLLSKLGCKITVSESRNISEIGSALQEIKDIGICLEPGGHQEKTFLGIDWILLSPGVPMNIPPLVKARLRGIPILSDIEFAYQITNLPIAAVTGTNGKTTTTMLLGEILKKGGKFPFVGGNIGVPILEAFITQQNYDLLVLEVSSFQLEAVTKFSPYIGIILNLTPDHMDRYLDIEEYKQAKTRILSKQTEKDYIILNAQDIWVKSLASICKAQVYFIDNKRLTSKGAGLREDHIIIRDKNTDIDLGACKDMGLKGIHNIENMMAASLAAYLLGATESATSETLKIFRGLPHRLEKVMDIRGVHFINDSKGTNVGAVIKAIESVDTPIILIAGGQDKGCDFKPLIPLIRKKLRAVFLIGEAKSKIGNCLKDYIEVRESGTLKDAVTDAYKMARAGDTVLLSPGCASFDMFRDYQDRGEQFKKIIMGL